MLPTCCILCEGGEGEGGGGAPLPLGQQALLLIRILTRGELMGQSG